MIEDTLAQMHNGANAALAERRAVLEGVLVAIRAEMGRITNAIAGLRYPKFRRAA